MPHRRMPRFLVIVSVLGLFALLPISFSPGPEVHAAPICDPPGPAPRFGCQWSLDQCDWFCPVCDPFGGPPRSTCTWDGNLCNWICPGYTGTDVTVRTVQGPVTDATVYLRLSSLCTATGAGAFCSGSFPVYQGMSTTQKCQAIADAIANNCSAAGYVVTMNDCLLESMLTASNLGCPATPFALGLSNNSGVFDQAGLGPLPDGESEATTGTSGSCSPMPGPVGNLQVSAPDGGGDVHLTWDDATDADDYLIFSNTVPNGVFSKAVGTASSGASGLTVGLLAGNEYFLVAGRNSSCGVGPKH
jgi:hypothetical protein